MSTPNTSTSPHQLSNDLAYELVRYNKTDSGNAERLIACHGDKLRFCKEKGSWRVFNGRRWIEDDNGALALVRDTMRKYQEAIMRTEFSYDELKFARSSEDVPKMKRTLEAAKLYERVAVGSDYFDKDPWLLCTRSGTIDLRTGKEREHRPEDRITKMAAASYDPEAKCPRWRAFLNHIFKGQAVLIRYLQRVAGYTLTGSIREQCFFLLYGEGANGKSTLLEVLRQILGDYARHAPVSTILPKRNGAVPNDVARLNNHRFVTVSELESRQHLAESRIKRLTGGDTITARFLHQEYFEFEPSFKLFIATNHRPLIRDADYAIWRRVRLIPFSVTIPPCERDAQLKEKLLEERAGILNWALEGCLQWQEQGLDEPQFIHDLVRAYRSEAEVVEDFLGDCTARTPDGQVKAKDLFERFTAWCGEKDHIPFPKQEFKRKLLRAGYKYRVSTGGYPYWYGLRLN